MRCYYCPSQSERNRNVARDWRAVEWEDESEQRFRALMECVETLLQCGRIRAPLAMAARLVEAAAYEAALREDPHRVSRLIVLAAELETLSDQYPCHRTVSH